MLARPKPPRLVSDSCSSARRFARRFFQRWPRGRSPCASLVLDAAYPHKGLSLPSHASCWAHMSGRALATSARAQISQPAACSGSRLIAAAKHLARQRPGAGVVIECHLTIHDGMAIAVGAAHTAPVAIGKIAHGFSRPQAQLLELV